MEAIGQAIYVGAGLFWKAFWALAFGYAFSSVVQVLVPRAMIGRYLGRPGPKETVLGMLLGPASSACSFAALSAARALFAKGAALVPMMAFLFGATNLGPAVVALAWIFLGWRFAIALVIGAFALVAAMALIVGMTYPREMVERARETAVAAGRGHAGASGDPAEGLAEAWRDKLQEREAWRRVGRAYRAEWGMVWKDLVIGFSVAGVVATLVPDAAFEAIFPAGLHPSLLVPLHALLGPVLALTTVIGSMGNGPLAAVLWEQGVLFAGIVAFLYSDFVVIPSLRINASYYGWRFTGYLAIVFTGSAVLAGIAVHILFAGVSLMPEPRAGQVQELAQFRIDYVFFLNVAAALLTVTLLWQARSAAKRGS